MEDDGEPNIEDEPLDIDEEPGTAANLAYLTRHVPQHISETKNLLYGLSSDPPFDASYYPPSSYWTSAEKSLFFHGLSIYSRFRPDMIAAHIGTKTVADVALYLELIRTTAAASTSSAYADITRDRFAQAYEVSPELISFEDEQSSLFSTAEPHLDLETRTRLREDEEYAFRKASRARRGSGTGQTRDRAGQKERKAALDDWLEERNKEWRIEDTLGQLDVPKLTVLDRILREDEEPFDVLDVENDPVFTDKGLGGTVNDSSIDPVLLAESSRALASRTLASSDLVDPSRPSTPPPAGSPGLTLLPKDLIPAELSPGSRRRLQKRLFMRKKRAAAQGTVPSTSLRRLKPGRKTKSEELLPEELVLDEQSGPEIDEHEVSAGMRTESPGAGPSKEKKRKKPKKRGLTLPYKIKHELQDAQVTAAYLRDQGLGLFQLAALGRIMRSYTQLDPTVPDTVNRYISMATVGILNALLVEFIRDLMHRAITVRELDFTLKARTKVWRIGKRRTVKGKNVRRALDLMGADHLNKAAHFSAVCDDFSDVEGDDEDEEEEDSPSPKAAKRKAAMIEDDEGDDETDVEAKTAKRASLSRHRKQLHRSIYPPFVHAPDLVPRSHPFGVDVRGKSPATSGHRHRPRQDQDDVDEDENLMSSDTDKEALDAELEAEERIDAEDMRAAAKYEREVWTDLQKTIDSDDGKEEPARTSKRKKRTGEVQSDSEFADLKKPKRRKVKKNDGAMNMPPDGVKVKSAVFVDSLSE
ncbi:hypothetical protein BV25DRAFT_1989669 [Artomyces pyxidatus]|uniref:Uncharacterized protein n=1 Tax=Artomyces pyxidatus TaxID=48021 RepID=A0ACB8T9H8_9AGAM|nr:hypothetical protein BV25DRAFT_1989669 [Artomyces pyxidatus]